jgi:hypothetical protein
MMNAIFNLVNRTPKGITRKKRKKKRFLARVSDGWIGVREGELLKAPGRFNENRDVKSFEVGPLAIQTCWKFERYDRGPAISLFAHNYELLRFDCFGAEHGHFHAMLMTAEPQKHERIYFFEERSSEQIDRTIFELNRNLYFYLKHNLHPEIREIEVDQEEWEKVLDEARAELLHHLNTRPELEVLRAPPWGARLAS